MKKVWVGIAISVFIAGALIARGSKAEDFTFMGMDAPTVMAMSPRGPGVSYPCSNWYNHGSIANKWCHGAVSKVVYAELNQRGMPPLLAHAGGIALLMVWESTNIRFDPTDLVTAPIVYEFNDTTTGALSLDMGGGFILNVTKEF
jgi:hypothetical protein